MLAGGTKHTIEGDPVDVADKVYRRRIEVRAEQKSEGRMESGENWGDAIGRAVQRTSIIFGANKPDHEFNDQIIICGAAAGYRRRRPAAILCDEDRRAIQSTTVQRHRRQVPLSTYLCLFEVRGVG